MPRVGSGKVAVALGAVLLFASQGWAFNPQPEPPGIFGVVSSQSIGVNIVNVGGKRNETCDVKLQLLDSAGAVVEELQVRDLQVARSSLLVVDAGRFGLAPGQRKQLRAVVVPLISPALGRSCNSLMLPTVEIFDTTTGESGLILSPAVLKGFNPQPEPPG
ncbi:MAG: hypothetical protein HY899_14125 [Deltaproteobacteria bacterium]|nr:hypothetical protein [Deltaproteobacteria bacterium]